MEGIGAPPGPQIEANGASLYVEEHGAGPPLVLVHGGTATHRMYDAVVPLLAPHCRVITFDDRGHGHSTNPSGELSYPLIADDTAALIAALGLERPFVGGWSDGGQVALELGLRYPGLARGLLVGGAYTDFQSPAARDLLRASGLLDNDDVADFAAFEQANPDWVALLRAWHPNGEDHWRRVRQQTLTMYLAYPGLSEAQLARIGEPAIVIHADHDESIPLEEALKLYRWLPRSELAVLPGSGHSRPFLEPAVFVAVLLDFVRRHR